MLEQIGSDTLVRNYTSNFDVKEYIQEAMIPKAFPNVPINKLNQGFTGIISEMMSTAIEDAYATNALMLNEAFITRAVLPDSIYAEASVYNLGYSFAKPSTCSFAVELWLPDIIKYSTKVKNTNTLRYKLDKDTCLVLGDNMYRFDYDVIIDHQFVDGKRVFDVYYDMSESNVISEITNKYVKHQVTSIDWLILFVDLMEYNRSVKDQPITDNLVTTNSDIKFSWSNGQIAGMSLVYVTPQGERLPMIMKQQYTNAEVDPFVWYRFYDDTTILLSFSGNKGYFTPSFNSKVEATIYTCRGKAADFDKYDRKAGIPVQKTGNRYPYNANTRIVALCYGGSKGGVNRGYIEDLRNEVIYARNTSDVLITDHDMEMWFNKYGRRYGTKAMFFKRRDDPTGKLFSQFIAITDDTYVYPTNTLTIDVNQDQFDFINNDSNGVNQEFIIKPGHLWEYADTKDDTVRDRVRMVQGINGGTAMITDDALPVINSERSFMFVNPFYIKIYRNPTISANYNCMISHTSWPEDVPISTTSFYQFQLATFSIERSISKKYNNKYKIQIICVPVITTDETVTYVEGIGEEYPVTKNNLRLVLVLRSKLDGETGYVEMTPVEIREGGSILYEANIAVYDNIRSDMMLEIDLDRSPDVKSLITTGQRKGKVLIDSSETSFHFICMMKDFNGQTTTDLFGDTNFKGYVMTNRFANAHRDLTLYKPLSMMRSVITFAGENNNYSVRASLIPFLKYDVPLDEDKMIYFIRAFGEQYTAMEPMTSKFGGNDSLDLKLYNTYGRSNNYFIGPKDGEESLWTSDILLDNVYVKIRFVMAVYDRSLWSATVEAVVIELQKFFDAMNSGNIGDIHVSDFIHIIIKNVPNVHYIRFVGFNDYDANKSSIFVKYSNISELREDQLQPYVPEMIRVDSNSIEITEEV